MKRILTLFTGGTIGSTGTNTIDVDLYSKHRLIEMFRNKYDRDVQLDILEPMSILSENMTMDTMYRLMAAISEVNFEDYDGVIVTHGSDTISYTSAFLGLVFGRVGIPIVLIAANKPLDIDGSNGLVNFVGAVDFILSSNLSGVFTIYRNCEDVEVFLATRILEADSFLECFTPFGGQPFGKMEQDKFIRNDFVHNPMPDGFDVISSDLVSLHPFHQKIMLLKPYPGMDYSFIHFSEKPAAILHLTYHSGTACTVGENYSFIQFAMRAKEEGIPVYVLPFKEDGEPLYASSQTMIANQLCIPLGKMSVEAAYAKLVLAYNLYDGDSKYIQSNTFFEYIV